jgi:hypothetical protein
MWKRFTVYNNLILLDDGVPAYTFAKIHLYWIVVKIMAHIAHPVSHPYYDAKKHLPKVEMGKKTRGERKESFLLVADDRNLTVAC